MSRAARPASGSMSRLNRVTYILAIALTDLPDHMPLCIIYIAAVAGIRPDLLAANKHLGRAVNRWQCEMISIHPAIIAIAFSLLCLLAFFLLLGQYRAI